MNPIDAGLVLNALFNGRGIDLTTAGGEFHLDDKTALFVDGYRYEPDTLLGYLQQHKVTAKLTHTQARYDQFTRADFTTVKP